MSSLRSVLIALLVVCPCYFMRNATSSASALTLHLNNTVTLILVALPGSPTLWIGRTPVTMCQFRAFVEASRYRTDAESPSGQRTRTCGWDMAGTRSVIGLTVGGRIYNCRHIWPLTDEHPVSNISWKDASAFCEWPSENPEDGGDSRPTGNRIGRHTRVRQLCISPATLRQVLRVMPTLQTDRSANSWRSRVLFGWVSYRRWIRFHISGSQV
jgi:hypothetical protein